MATWLTENEDFETSKVLFLPYIYGKPGDYNTLFTGVNNCLVNAESAGLKTCIIKADQPLYIKIRDIISSKILSDLFVCGRLGSFYTAMSYIGCIGFVMSGSGIEQALGTV